MLNAGAGGMDYGISTTVVHVDFVYDALRGLRFGITGDLHALPLSTHSVDAVVCVGSVLNYVSLAEAISEISRVCRPGGLLLLEYERSESPIFRGSAAYKMPVGQIRAEYRQAVHSMWVYSDRYVDTIIDAANLVILESGWFHGTSAIAAGHGLRTSIAARLATFDRLFKFMRQFAANRWLLATTPLNSPFFARRH